MMPGQRSGSVTPAIVSDSALTAAQYGFTGCARTMLFVNVAELGLLLAAVVLPVVLGMVSAFMRRPWWWAAIVAAVVAGLAWLGWFLTRRLRRRSAAPAGQEPRLS